MLVYDEMKLCRKTELYKGMLRWGN